MSCNFAHFPCIPHLPRHRFLFVHQVGALEIKFWEAFCKALDIPDLVDKQMAQGEEGIAARARLQVRNITSFIYFVLASCL